MVKSKLLKRIIISVLIIGLSLLVGNIVVHFALEYIRLSAHMVPPSGILGVWQDRIFRTYLVIGGVLGATTVSCLFYCRSTSQVYYERNKRLLFYALMALLVQFVIVIAVSFVLAEFIDVFNNSFFMLHHIIFHVPQVLVQVFFLLIFLILPTKKRIYFQ